MPRLDVHRAGTVTVTSCGATSCYAVAVLVLLGAVVALAGVSASGGPLAVVALVCGAVVCGAGGAVGSVARVERAGRDVERVGAEQVARWRRAQRGAAAGARAVVPVGGPVDEPVPGPGDLSPVGGGHLVTLARPPAARHCAG